MFLPGGRNFQQESQDKKRTLQRVENLALECLPEHMRSAATVSIQEVQCGDPECAPIDTVVTIIFESGGQGMFGLPMEAKDVTAEELAHMFPTMDVVEKWFAGEEAEWPPQQEVPPLRFDIGTAVLCKVGGSSNGGWAPGHIIQLWYREQTWPEGAFAPYKIKLEDGRDIFAPADMDQIIKLNPNGRPMDVQANKA